MPISPAYTFQNILVDDIIRESFERCGIQPTNIVPEQMRSARFSLNFLCIEYVNRGLNLFTVHQNVMDIVPGQQSYLLDPTVIDILECTVGQLSRVTETGSIPFSSAGNAANAFDGNWATSCNTGNPFGSVGIQFPTAKSVAYVGIVVPTFGTYSFNILSSNNNADWIENEYIPPKTYMPGQRYWFPIDISNASKYWKIQGASDNTTNVSISELYFSVPLIANTYNSGMPSRVLVREKRQVWMQQPLQNLVAPPNFYYLDRGQDNILRFWPVPDNTYSQIIYTTKNYINTISNFTQTLPMPARFFDTLSAGLAARLSTKYAPERKDLLQMEAIEAFKFASGEDFERAPFEFGIDFGGYSR